MVNGVAVLSYIKRTSHTGTLGELHIKFSDDYGTTWTDEDKYLNGDAVTGFPMTPPAPGENAQEPYLITASNGNLLLHFWDAYDGGSYQSVSTDDGATWGNAAKIDFVGSDNDDLIHTTEDHFVYDGVIYSAAREFIDAAASQTRRIFVKSTDNGATWDFVSIMFGYESTENECGLEYIGNDTIIAIYRAKTTDKTYRSYSFDMGATWSALENVTATLPAIGRPRLYTAAHLRGEANWWEDTHLILCGYAYIPGNRHTYIAQSWDAGASWDIVFYVDEPVPDAGYSELFYNPTNGHYILEGYHWANDQAVVKQYDLTVTW